MPSDHWENLYRSWSTLKVPVRANANAVAAIKAEVASVTRCVLLLGFTPALAQGSYDLVAIDQNAALAKSVWPGNAARRRAVIGRWFPLPFAEASFGACIGDGSLATLEYPGKLDAFMAELARVLEPGGKFVCHVFTSPDQTRSVAQLKDEAFARRLRNFQFLKFQLAMSVARSAGSPNISVASIATAFDEAFPDRAALAEASGWDLAEIDMIDVYRPSSAVYSFPTRADYLSRIPAAFGKATFVDCESAYPILVLERG